MLLPIAASRGVLLPILRRWRATVIAYVNPLVAVLLGVLLPDEAVSLGMFAAFVLIVLGPLSATAQREPGVAAGLVRDQRP